MMITCWTDRPKSVSRPLAVMSPAPAAMPAASGVLPLDVRPLMADLTVAAFAPSRARSTWAVVLWNEVTPTWWLGPVPTPPLASRLSTSWSAACWAQYRRVWPSL